MSAALGSVQPEIYLLAGALGTLLTGSFLPRRRQWGARLVAVAALLAAAATTGIALTGPDSAVFDGTYLVDRPTVLGRLVVIGATLLVIALGVDELAGRDRESETYTLLLLGALGSIVLSGAGDLLVVAVGFLLASIPLYALVGMTRTAPAAEAAVKTYLLGVLLGILLLLGVVLLSGVGGGTRYADLTESLSAAPAGVVAAGAVAVLGGLLFKAGAVPGHFWVPDAAQGAVAAAAAFVTTVPKIGGLIAAYRLVDTVPDGVPVSVFIAVIAALSMTLGNLAALGQDDPRRLLGWSTVSQAGYLLIPVAAAGRSDLAMPALLLYLAGYAVSNLTAFAVTTALPRRRSLSDYRGLAAGRPWLAASLVVGLLSLVGTPPTAVFAGKLAAFTAGWDGGLPWLVLLAVLNTVASLFYYLRWIGPTLRRAPDEGGPVPDASNPWARTTALCGGIGVLGMGLAAGTLLALFPP